MLIRHQVPYFSQWESAGLVDDILTGDLLARDDPKWADSGARTPEEYEFWSWRACGMACLRMVLAARGLAVPAMVPLAEECAAAGGYVRHEDRVEGLIYAPFVDWITDRFGVAATVHRELGVEDVMAHVAQGHLVMISVHPWLRWPDRTPPRRGGHLVLVTGVEEGRLLLHNPSGLPGESQEYYAMTVAELTMFAAGRGVLFEYPAPTPCTTPVSLAASGPAVGIVQWPAA